MGYDLGHVLCDVRRVNTEFVLVMHVDIMQ